MEQLNIIKPYMLSELAKFYGIDYKTLEFWLEPYVAVIGKKRGRYFTPLQVKTIVEIIGMPTYKVVE